MSQSSTHWVGRYFDLESNICSACDWFLRALQADNVLGAEMASCADSPEAASRLALLLTSGE